MKKIFIFITNLSKSIIFALLLFLVSLLIISLKLSNENSRNPFCNNYYINEKVILEYDQIIKYEYKFDCSTMYFTIHLIDGINKKEAIALLTSIAVDLKDYDFFTHFELHSSGFEKVMFAVDELTGLIGAGVLMRPSKTVMDMEADSVKRKFKDKHFAAGCSRDIIRTGAERLGWELNDLFAKTILGMRDCEASVRSELAALEG